MLYGFTPLSFGIVPKLQRVPNLMNQRARESLIHRYKWDGRWVIQTTTRKNVCNCIGINEDTGPTDVIRMGDHFATTGITIHPAARDNYVDQLIDWKPLRQLGKKGPITA